jgi:hypothetical protein
VWEHVQERNNSVRNKNHAVCDVGHSLRSFVVLVDVGMGSKAFSVGLTTMSRGGGRSRAKILDDASVSALLRGTEPQLSGRSPQAGGWCDGVSGKWDAAGTYDGGKGG